MTWSDRISPSRHLAPRRSFDYVRHGTVDLSAALREEWIKVWNDNTRPFEWTKTADQILDRICRYCDRISGPRL